MFGIYRMVLATVVVFDHFGGYNGVGAVSVFGFFCLSGFLMTLLTTETYRGNISIFYTNRFLRIYPLYWTTFLMALVVAWATSALQLPANPLDFIDQALLVVRYNDSPIYVPTAWAVTNEIVFYLLIGMGISRTLTRSLVWLTASVALTAALYLHEADLYMLYFPVVPASLPFAVGASLYHLNKHIPAIPAPYVVLGLAACGMGATMLQASFSFLALKDQAAMMYWAYLSFIPSALIVLVLSRLHAPRFVSIDTAIGRLSYPIYLLQFLGAGLAARWGLYRGGAVGLFEAIIVLTTTIILSLFALALVDTPIEKIRRRLRPRRAAAPGQVSEPSAPFISAVLSRFGLRQSVP